MLLVEPRTLQRGYFEPAALRMALENHLRKRRNMSDLLWRLLIFELWHRNFLGKYIPLAGISSFRCFSRK
jgi:hypothetical protein